SHFETAQAFGNCIRGHGSLQELRTPVRDALNSSLLVFCQRSRIGQSHPETNRRITTTNSKRHDALHFTHEQPSSSRLIRPTLDVMGSRAWVAHFLTCPVNLPIHGQLVRV